MEESYYGKLLFIINKKYFKSKQIFIKNNEQDVKNISHNQEDVPQKVTFEGLFTIFQESKPLYHPQLLRQYFIKGHINLVLKILVKLHTLLQFDTKSYKIPSL